VRVQSGERASSRVVNSARAVKISTADVLLGSRRCVNRLDVLQPDFCHLYVCLDSLPAARRCARMTWPWRVELAAKSVAIASRRLSYTTLR